MSASALLDGTIGILPPGALGVALFHHLSGNSRQLDGRVFLVERGGSGSARALREAGSLTVADGQDQISLPISQVLRGDLTSCGQAGCLPEVLLVCPNPDQLLGVITTLIELVILGQAQLQQGESPLPIVILAANGIYFQRVRQLFIEKLEEATLFGRLPDLWPERMPLLVSRLLRGVTLQTGLRESSGSTSLYRPGPRGLTRIAGGESGTRARAQTLLTHHGGWYELAQDLSPTRLEFEKALVNLSSNLLGLIAAIDGRGHFQVLTVGELFAPERLPRIRELAFHLLQVGLAVRAFGDGDDLESLLSGLTASSRLHQEHVPSSLQWVGMMLRNGALEAKLPPTETWLLDPLVFYANGGGLDETVRYFEGLRTELIDKLALAIRAASVPC